MKPPRPALVRFGPLVVVLVAVAASVAGVVNQFTWDDVPIIRDDVRLHGLGMWREIFTTPYWPPPALPDLYRPVTSFLLAIQYAVGSGSPIVFRIGSYALYAATSVGVLRLASRLCSPPVALAIAVLFAAHPVHVEAVATAVGQSELIVCLLATVMVARYLRCRESSGDLRTRDWAGLAVMYLFAGLAKEQGILLPALLLAAEAVVTDAGSPRTRVVRLWKGYAALALTGIAVVLIRTSVLGGQLGAPVVTEALRDVGLGGRTLTLLQIVPEWLRLLVWPEHLRIEYRPQDFLASTALGSVEGLGLLLVIGAAVVAWAARRRAPPVTLGIAWMAVALFPVSNLLLPTFVFIAERTLLLPSVGFLLAIGGALDLVLRRPGTGAARYRILAIAVGLLVIAGVTRSALRHRVWRTPYTLMAASVRDAPRSWHVWSSLGDLLFDSARPDDAVLAYQKALELVPEPWRVRNDFAMRLRSAERDGEAVEQLRLSLAAHPDQVMALAQLPAALIALGKYAEARHLADSVITTAGAPPMMVWLRRLADSAIAVKAPPGSIRVGIELRP